MTRIVSSQLSEHVAEQFVADLDIPVMKAHGRMRARVRASIAASDLGPEIEDAVSGLLGTTSRV